MEKYSVLLVDDEEDVIQIIMKKMDWESMGFQIAGYAHNGVETLEMAEELQPDVVMTDIKMPYMDGLTLSRKLKELYRTVKIIIFSGFDEFEYAKEAIQIEVEEYILKPIDAGNLKEVFGRIREKIDREMDEKRNVDKLKKYYMESLPILQENFYTSLIDGRIPEGKVDKYLSNYQISLTGPYYVVSILHVSTSDIPQNMNPFLLGVSVKKLAEEHMKEEWKSRILMYLGDILVITQLEAQEQITEFTDFMDQFCRLAKHVCEATVTAGIGYVCDNLLDIRLSWQGARSAVSYRVIYGNARAINIAEIDPMKNGDERWEEQEIQKILKRIRMGSREELETEISHCIRRFVQNGTTMQKYQIFIMGLLTEIFRFCSNNQLDSTEFYGEKGETFERCMQMESPEELEHWLLKICEKLQKTVQQERQASTKSFVSRAVEYVQEHYNDRNITVESVCRELGVSAAYFSTIFKKETGKTFISFLTDYRMEKAVELLMTTSDKTYIIAEKVGYADPNYFSYAFKKQYSMSPSKYRTANSQ
ncbi:response regulator [Blautia wexlerae]|uniref:response regulator n=1 Tax=Blautia wexlerae TaxID=418240 RepID=UPI0004056776|nr:response regulator [Blautia wexlerae]